MFDATPIIYLATVERLSLVQHLDGSGVIPERVHEEVVDGGLEQEYSDARRIERHVADGHFEVIAVESTPLMERLQTNENLSDADVAVLACVDANDAIAVVDETYGRDVAAEGITTRGTTSLVLHLANDGAISVADARSVIDAMLEAGWYCAPDLYAKIVQILESIAESRE